jgi:hypothetical protein
MTHKERLKILIDNLNSGGHGGIPPFPSLKRKQENKVKHNLTLSKILTYFIL